MYFFFFFVSKVIANFMSLSNESDDFLFVLMKCNNYYGTKIFQGKLVVKLMGTRALLKAVLFFRFFLLFLFINSSPSHLLCFRYNIYIMPLHYTKYTNRTEWILNVVFSVFTPAFGVCLSLGCSNKRQKKEAIVYLDP